MRKKIVAVGNSAGLVIDRSILRLMELKVGSYVSIDCDGRFLVLGKAADQSDDATVASATARDTEAQVDETVAEIKYLTTRARSIFDTLLRWNIPFHAFAAIYHGTATPPDPTLGPRGWIASMSPYSHWMWSNGFSSPSSAEVATMWRFEILFRERKAGATWDEAVKVALEEIPMLRESEEVPMTHEPTELAIMRAADAPAAQSVSS